MGGKARMGSQGGEALLKGSAEQEPQRLSKGTRTRQRIVGHATLLMYANGFACTSIEDVIRAAGITKGSFYFHFRSKEDLGRAVIENASGFILGRMRKALERPGLSSRERLEAMLREVQGVVEEADCARGCILGNLALETSHDHPVFREAIASAFRSWWELIASQLERMKEEGELPPHIDCQAYAQFALGAMEGGIMLSKVTRDPGPMRNSVALILEQLGSLLPAQRDGGARNRSAPARETAPPSPAPNPARRSSKKRGAATAAMEDESRTKGGKPCPRRSTRD